MRYAEPGAARGGSCSTRSRKSGETRSPSSANWMPASKPPDGPARPVEGQQGVEVRGGDRAAVGAAGERADHLPGAGLLVVGPRRPAHEDALAAGAVRRPGGAQRALDLDAAHVHRRELGIAQLRGGPPPGAGALRRRDGPVDERHAHEPRAALRREPHVQMLVGRAPVLGDGHHAGRQEAARLVRADALAADVEQLQPQAVEADIELLADVETLDGVVVEPPSEVDPQPVLAVGRKVVAHGGAAPRSEREILAEAALLHEKGRDLVGRNRRRLRRIAHGETADLARRAHVALQQPRRERQHVADVVEAVAGLVGRQQRPAVDFQGQQVADRVGVLEPVEAADDRPPGIGPRVGRPVELRLEPGGEAVVGGRFGARPPGRRHLAGAELADHLLPGFRGLADVSDVDPIEIEPAGPQPLVVAGDAVAVEQRTLRIDGRGRRRLRVDRPRSEEAGRQNHADSACEHSSHRCRSCRSVTLDDRRRTGRRCRAARQFLANFRSMLPATSPAKMLPCRSAMIPSAFTGSMRDVIDPSLALPTSSALCCW